LHGLFEGNANESRAGASYRPMKTMLALLWLGAAALAADIDGKWRADSTFPRGMKVTEYLELKLEQGRLAGRFTDGFGGTREIKDAKLAGNRITFWMDWDDTGKCQAEGTLRENVLELVLVTKNARRSLTARRQ
jgi:hypothetical protein